MIIMNMYQKVRKFKKRDYSIKRISEKLQIDRKTVRKYCEMSEIEYVQYRKNLENKDRVFDIYRDEILSIYRVNDGKIYGSSIFDVLEEKYGKLPGSERTLRNYLQYLNKSGEINSKDYVRLYVPVEDLPLGKQLQLDFGEIEIASGQRIYIFGVVLSASRFKYVAVQKRPFKTIDVINHLLDSFEIMGGLPDQIVIDQDKVMVVKENSGDIAYTKEFKDFKSEMGFSMYVCRKADPESKGKVENLVKFVKTSFFSARSFHSFEEIPVALSAWLNRRANGKISQATGMIPSDVLEKERAFLNPLKPSIYRRESILSREPRDVDGKSMISVGASLYSVPKIFIKKQVWIFRTDTELFLYDAIDGKEIAKHKISLFKGNKIIQKNHFRNYGEKPETLIEKLKDRCDSESWKSFVDANYRKYNRYYRDQNQELSDFLNQDPDIDLLLKAIDLCIENETLSAKNLRETYAYMHGCENEKYPDILPQLLTGIRAVKHENKNIKVKKRELSYYTSLVSLLGGAL